MKTKSFILGILLMIVLSACTPSVTPIVEVTQTSVPATEAVVEVTEVPVDDGCEDGYRLFDHELLATDPICVPENPQRVAFIDEMVGVAPVLGIESVTRSVYFDFFRDDFPNAFSESQRENMVDIGHPREANIETILLAEPDLIISGNYWEDANKFLPDVAPTIIWDYDITPDWKAYFLAIGDVVNRKTEAEQALTEVDERFAILQEQVSDKSETYVVVRTMDGLDHIQVFTTMNFGAEHLDKLGLSMPEGVLTPEEAAGVSNAWWYPLSVEELPTLDADHIFLLSGWEPAIQEDFLASPLWQSLEAVQNDRVHFIQGEYWVRIHPIGSQRVIDDLFTYVVGVDPTEIAPNPYLYTYAP